MSASRRVRKIGRVPVFGLSSATSPASSANRGLDGVGHVPVEEAQPHLLDRSPPVMDDTANRNAWCTLAKILASFSKS